MQLQHWMQKKIYLEEIELYAQTMSTIVGSIVHIIWGASGGALYDHFMVDVNPSHRS